MVLLGLGEAPLFALFGLAVRLIGIWIRKAQTGVQSNEGEGIGRGSRTPLLFQASVCFCFFPLHCKARKASSEET